MKILSILGNIFGIGKSVLENRARLKELKQEQELKIIEAETNALLHRIETNVKSDNEIDLITARNKRYTTKDDIITYLFLTPVVIAVITPFITAYNLKKWECLNTLIIESFGALDSLPSWYRYVLGLIIIDVLGFRSFMRSTIERWGRKTFFKK